MGNSKVSLLALLLFALPQTAFAGEVTGIIKLRTEPKPPPMKSGFASRIPNPIIAPRPYNWRPKVVIVFEGDTKGESKDKVYELQDHSFENPVIAVQVGRKVTIKNSGTTAPSLVCKGCSDGAFENGALNPKGSRELKAKSAGILHLVAERITHLRGTILVLDTPHFAVVDAKGNYTIDDVPDGKWKVKVWYDGGWLKETKSADVSGSKTKFDLMITSLEKSKD